VLCFLPPVCVCAQPSRLIVDDDQYEQQVIDGGRKLLREGKLISLESLRSQVRTHGIGLRTVPISSRKLDPPALCDRLRESTLAVATLYKCPDCGGWHLNSSAGFVFAEGGIICTCCHVVLAADQGVKEAYLLAADSSGRVFPVRAVVAADTESDTCLLRIEAPPLPPLPLRTGALPGERVFCLSHPGGYYFMFTQGMVSRLNRRRNELLSEPGQKGGELTRPVLFLNITAEFAPGSSGAPVVDEAGNVLGQVASIADAGEPDARDETSAPSPSVPVRFCTAAEEILRLTAPWTRENPRVPKPKPNGKPKPEIRKVRQNAPMTLSVPPRNF